MLFQTVQEVIEDIRTAWREGRGIVPLLGAGFSAEAGVPTLEGVARYLAQLRGYVREPTPVFAVPAQRLDKARDYVDNPFRFVKDQGWPDYYHLRQNFGRHLSESQPRRQLEEEINRQFDELAALLYPEQVAELNDVLDETEPTYSSSFMPRQLNSARWKLLGRWPDLVHHVTGGDVGYARSLFGRLRHGRRPGLSHRFLAFLTRLLGIRLFLSTMFDDLLEQALRAEEIDHTVFVMEAGRRFPLSGLVRSSTALVKMDGDLHNLLVGGPMHLPLEETCLEEFKRSLPHRPLLLVLGSSGGDRRVLDLVRHVARHHKGERSVIWLHYEAVPPRSVTSLPELNDPDCYRFVRVLHPGLFLSHLYSALTSRHPASLEPYLAHPQRPIGLQPRDAVPEKWEFLPAKTGVRVYHNKARSCYLFSDLPQVTMSASTPNPQAGTDSLRKVATNASERLAAFVNNLRSHIPIWIDLEGQYTLAGVVGAIIDQCRTYDPTLTPSVLPLGEDAQAKAIEKGASRVIEALCRARYVLALDALEAYTWPHTVHHGDLESDSEVSRKRKSAPVAHAIQESDSEVSRKRKPLIDFLKVLIKGADDLHNSVVCMSIGPPAPRRSGQPVRGAEVETLATVEMELCEVLGAKEQEGWVYPGQGQAPTYIPAGAGSSLEGVLVTPAIAPPNGEKFSWSSPNASRLALLSLSCFRRTRNLVGLRSILNHLVRDGAKVSTEDPYYRVDEALKWFQEADYLLPVEGGGYWMSRQLRDEIYEANSALTGTAMIRKHVSKLRDLTQTPQAEDITRTALQCLLLSFHHDRIARYYYFDNYVQSQDSFAFFEYVYHRVSSIRYLTKLVLLRELARNRHSAIWNGVCEACQKALAGVPADHFDIQAGDIESLLDPRTEILQDRRKREIRSLRFTWQRSRTVLQRSVPAEQLMSWCRWLINDDLPRFRASEYGSRVGASENANFARDATVQAIVKKLDLNALDSEVEDAVKGLEQDLYDLWAQSARERSGYDQCIKLRLRQQVLLFTSAHDDWSNKEFHRTWTASQEKTSKSAADDASDSPVDKVVEHFFKMCRNDACGVLNQMLPERSTSPPDKKDPMQKVCTWWLDIAECLSAQDKQEAFNGQPNFERTTKLLVRIEELLSPPREDDITRAMRFRCQLLQAEHHLGSVTFWRSSYLYADGTRTEEIGKKVDELSRRALIAVRQHDLEVGREYFDYRASFLITRGRARTLRTFPPSFHDAYRDLDLARSGALSADRLLRARADFFGIELILIETDELLVREAGLRRGEGREPIGCDPWRKLLDRAAAKYAVARGYLQRLPAQLLGSRRNTVWWKFFFQLIAQFQSERNLWVLAESYERRSHTKGTGEGVKPQEATNVPRRLPDPDPVADDGQVRPNEATAFLQRLRRGLLAIRRGLDRDLDPKRFDPWLQQAWREMFFCSVLYWRLTDLSANSSSPDILAKEREKELGSTDDRSFFSWWSLNRSVGLLVGQHWDKWKWEEARDLLRNFWKAGSAPILLKARGKIALGDDTFELPLRALTGLRLRHAVGQIAQTDHFGHPLLDYKR